LTIDELTFNVVKVNDTTVDEPTVDEPTVDEPTVDELTFYHECMTLSKIWREHAFQRLRNRAEQCRPDWAKFSPNLFDTVAQN
jgi:hypothetical protein